MDSSILLKGIKNISDGASKLAAWTFTIIGGTILIILSDSYFHPMCSCLRLIYLLFIPGWVFLAVSIYYGTNTMRRAMAAEFWAEKQDPLIDIFKKSNKDFSNQLQTFRIGLLIYAIWLMLYLIWWIFSTLPTKS
jgi:hypothetical protein